MIIFCIASSKWQSVFYNGTNQWRLQLQSSQVAKTRVTKALHEINQGKRNEIDFLAYLLPKIESHEDTQGYGFLSMLWRPYLRYSHRLGLDNMFKYVLD